MFSFKETTYYLLPLPPPPPHPFQLLPKISGQLSIQNSVSIIVPHHLISINARFSANQMAYILSRQVFVDFSLKYFEVYLLCLLPSPPNQPPTSPTPFLPPPTFPLTTSSLPSLHPIPFTNSFFSQPPYHHSFPLPLLPPTPPFPPSPWPAHWTAHPGLGWILNFQVCLSNSTTPKPKVHWVSNIGCQIGEGGELNFSDDSLTVNVSKTVQLVQTSWKSSKNQGCGSGMIYSGSGSGFGSD